MKQKSEKSVSIGNMVHQNEVFFKHEMEELNAATAEAKEYMCHFDAKFPYLKHLGESMDQYPPFNSHHAFPPHTCVNSNASSGNEAGGTETVSKDEDEVSLQEENVCGTETMSDDATDASATYSLKCKVEQEDGENHKKYINLEIVPREHPQGNKVVEALKLFKEEYAKLLQEHGSEPAGEEGTNFLYYRAYNCVKQKKMNFIPDKPPYTWHSDW